jgi:hypothetical protein
MCNVLIAFILRREMTGKGSTQCIRYAQKGQYVFEELEQKVR